MKTKKQYSCKKHTRKRFGGVSTESKELVVAKRLVSANPQVKKWVSSQSKPGTTISGIREHLNAIRLKSFITYKRLLRRVIEVANAFQSKGYKVVDIAGSTTKPIEFFKDSQKRQHHLIDNLYNRVTEFTIYYRKYKFHEPLAKSLLFDIKKFSNYYENELMHNYIASFMTKHDVLCHVDLPFTSTSRSKPENIKLAHTLVVFFYYSE